ncbi:MAG: MTH1187 family thiamine-binding protein [Bacteroidia bacterium]|nr:MTH1187 family thiamine-binding protein [Bacteroidia bacterium]
MSVLMEFAMFPTDVGTSKSEFVSKVIEMIRNDVPNYKLTAMGTIIETETLEEALAVVQKAQDILLPHTERIYSTVKFDIRKNCNHRLDQKIKSIENRIGDVNK